MKTARRWMLRLLAVGVMGAALTGPAPGNVQGCNQTAPVADARTFCGRKEEWSCTRESVAMRITAAEYEACTAEISTSCSGFIWPTDCQPTQSAADRCIDGLLRNPSFLPIPTDDLLRMYDHCNLCD